MTSETQDNECSGSATGYRAGVHPAVTRLKALVRNITPGQCKVLSKGSDCTCGLCDAERLQETLDDCLEIINDAILHGMPVTEKIANVSNLIRGQAR